MNDFLMIVPEAYTELDAIKYMQTIGLEASTLVSLKMGGTLYEFANFMETCGELPIGMMVADLIVDGGSGYRLWVKLEPER